MSTLGVLEKGFSAADITGALLDSVGKDLGLSEANMDFIKIGIGIVTANPIMVANGAMGLVGDLVEKNKTENAPPQKGPDGKACVKGYAASPSAPPPPQYGPAERFSMDSEAFAKWCPSDPYTKQLHDQYLAAKAGKCPNGLTEHEAKRALETQLKYALDRNPAARAEFESYFGVKVVDPKVDQCGDIIVKPLISGAVSSDVGNWSGQATGGTNSTGGSTDSDVGHLSSLRGELKGMNLKAKMEELRADGELDEADMLELQELMAKKQQMFSLISTLMSMENQMAMTAIQNMKG